MNLYGINTQSDLSNHKGGEIHILIVESQVMLLIKNKELADLREGCNKRDAELDMFSGAAQATRTADANVSSDATIA